MSALNVVLSFSSSVLSFVFAAMVFDQWWQRRHAFQLVWAVGLLWYGISAGTEFLGSAFGWSEPSMGYRQGTAGMRKRRPHRAPLMRAQRVSYFSPVRT